MFFNLFGKKEKGPTFIDVIFITDAAKAAAIVQLAKEKPHSIFVAWFDNTEKYYRNLFDQVGITGHKITNARQLNSVKATDKDILFLEHFPLRNKEEMLVQHFEQKEFKVYSSLDEPLFSLFGSDRIADLMRKMGMSEDEAIQHDMISKSIRKAQEKIADKMIIETTAASQKDWMAKNMK